MTIRSVDPRSGEEFARYEPHDDQEVERRLALAAAAWTAWRERPLRERCRCLEAAADRLDERRDQLATLMTREMGKPVAQASAEIEKCAWVCRYYASEAPAFLADEPAESEAQRSRIRYDPLGPVLAVMPWNFPLWQVFRFAAPALAAGNVGLLKHASNVPGCALAIERLFRDAGLPGGTFQALLIGGSRVESVLEDPRIRAATLTGSEPAGRSVAAAAGRGIKKTLLELGGSDPFIVLADADLAKAASTAVGARVQNNGQSCIAAKRFVVEDPVADAFEERLVEGMRALRVGDPLEADTDVGPLATEAIREELHAQVEASVQAGARLLLGGTLPAGPGYYYPPTVLADAPADSAARREELFGPVAVLVRVRDADEALTVANETEFGLGASLWTGDRATAERLVPRIEAGFVAVNRMVASDPRLPFGGVKKSGYGRELGRFGIREFVNVKTVCLDP